MRVAAGLAAAFVCSAALATGAEQRTLSFDERVSAQAAIERVYYAHQIGATKPFDEAVPRAVLENKVRKYLEQTVALQTYWKTAVTDETLQRELERMAQGTRMPERLQELYTALGNDPFLIKECLARATLVDRLTHNFYAFDPTMHVDERTKAEAIHRQLATGKLSPLADHPNRTVIEVTATEKENDQTPADQPFKLRLGSAEFQKRRAELPAHVGEVSTVEETRDAFEFDVPLGERVTEVRVASYVVPKITWDAWWDMARRPMTHNSVQAVASTRGASPVPRQGLPLSPRLACPDDDTWESWTLREVPTPRRLHTAIWTGSVMVVWGGFGPSSYTNTGSRYDPATDTWLSTSTLGAPSARYLHRAVWTGNTMVIWGGRAFPYTNTGGQYDPINDSWTATSVVGAPSARTNHTAIWTGSRIVVWGGGVGATSTQTGGLYDPANDTWTATSTIGAPSARSGHTAIWTGSVMVIWGSFNTGGRYDPSSDTWTATSTVGAPSPRVSHTAVWTGSLMVVWGGSSTNTGGRYDPAADTWNAISTIGAPTGRSGHEAVWTGNLMVVWGGASQDEQGFPYYLNTGGRYDPVTDTWAATSTAGAPSGRSNHSAVWTGNSVIVWGGSFFDAYDDSDHYYETGGRYDPAADAWTPTSLVGTPRGRTSHTATWTGNVMVIWGGYDGYIAGLNTGGRYDPATDNWAATSMMDAPSSRYLHSAVWTGSAVLVWGGADQGYPIFGNTGGRYDPVADSWSPTSLVGAPSGRYAHAAVWTGSEMLVWGGHDADYPITGGRYNPSTDTWTAMTTAGAPSGREYFSSVWTGHAMVVWGGQSSSYSFLDTGGRYDPSSDRWTPSSMLGVPLGRWLHSTVWTGSVMVVWGGETLDPGGGPSHFFDSGGRYDPVANVWTPISTINAPSPRGDHAAIWTGREMVVWGGFGGVYLGTGGRYDPSSDTWTATSTVGAPPARTGHSAVWSGSAMLVWGGYENASPFLLLDSGGTYHLTSGEVCNGIDDDCDGAIDDGGDALCDDGNPCTEDSCQGADGCVATNSPNQCNDNNPCTDDSCSPGIGCAHANNTNPCNDGNACTHTDVCSNGACVGSIPVVCGALDQCHTVGVCDPASGACSNPIQPNGTVCNDASLCTTGETCQSGTCTPAFSGLNEPNPRSNGYYMRLCLGPHSGDQLTDPDAVCVGQVATTFAGIATVADLCAVLRPQHPNDDPCDRTSADLMVLALNICHARVCTAQSIDSQCGGNGNVGQSLAESDAILLSPSRDDDTCAHAKCLDEEINTGRALELTSLGLRRDGSGIRLDWSPPYLDDGTGHPSKYHVWRRVQGSLAPFAMIGTTTSPTYLDSSSGSGAFEYEVTAVMN